MAKRGASKELNHENWAEEEEPEEMGTFRKASSEQMVGRQIKKARRRGGVVEDSSSSSVFKGFPSFAGFGANKESSQPSFSFLSKIPSNEPPARPKEVFSSSFSDTKSLTSTSGINSSDNKSPIQPFQFCQQKSTTFQDNKTAIQPILPRTVPISVDSSKVNGVGPTKTIADSSGKGGSKIFLAHLKALNEGVLLWVKQHLDKNSHVNLSPVFDDYKKHFEELSRKYPPASGGESDSEVGTANSSKKDEASGKENKPLISQPTTKESVPPKNFTFSGSTTSTSSNGKSPDTNKMLFTFGSRASTAGTEKTAGDLETKPLTYGGFDTSNKKVESSIFGGSVSKSGKGFSFGGLTPSETSSSTSSGFSFQGSSTPAATGGSVRSEGLDEPNDEPPKVEINEVKEEDALYEKKCKLFYMKDEEYVEKGIGTLFLKPAGDKTQLVIRALTNLGNILLNIILNASIPAIRAGKNGVIIACIPNPPLDGKSKSTEPVKMLIRVKTGEDADKLLEKINELKK
ncbi:nuclear pore complex protein Nup50-like isoform X2 [Homarus americanus]|nr:nuclear pore complex protein Nup50-like isoform X2 [Homarus americanus]XP_042219092.1 nuclear pore complex protein Nup50-like isoform X2 [Homarus americanus]